MRALPIFAIATMTIAACLDSFVRSENPIQEKIQRGLLNATLNLVDVLYKPQQNLLFSPFNIYSALALVHLITTGETEEQLTRFLNFPSTNQNSKEKIHEALSEFLKITQDTTAVPVYTANGFENQKLTDVKLANGIFTQKELQLRQSYVSQIQNLYNGTIDKVDFAKTPDKATDHINGYVSKQTNGLIPKLLKSPLEKDTRIIIAASLYFKASWSEKFSEAKTQIELFDTGYGKVSAHMMHGVDSVPYIDHNVLGAEMIGLPYEGHDVSTYFILPHKSESLQTVLGRLKNMDIIGQLINGTKSTYVDYKIPRTEYEQSQDIVNQLKSLGIQRVFQDNAQLDLVEGSSLKVDEVTHATKIIINENGTEAAAVTAIKMVPMSYVFHPAPVPFHLNRQFIFFIFHKKTQSVLFFGIVHNPKPNEN